MDTDCATAARLPGLVAEDEERDLKRYASHEVCGMNKASPVTDPRAATDGISSPRPIRWPAKLGHSAKKEVTNSRNRAGWSTQGK